MKKRVRSAIAALVLASVGASAARGQVPRTGAAQHPQDRISGAVAKRIAEDGVGRGFRVLPQGERGPQMRGLNYEGAVEEGVLARKAEGVRLSSPHDGAKETELAF